MNLGALHKVIVLKALTHLRAAQHGGVIYFHALYQLDRNKRNTAVSASRLRQLTAIIYQTRNDTDFVVALVSTTWC